jgi:LysR family transcriptional activator of nhaA
MEWLNFRHLYAFWAVCRYGGFSKAAERVFVSQSTVSEQVGLLEGYLGEELLERSTRAVKVTDRGAALLEMADEIFSRSYEINHIFRDKNASLRPTNIRVGMVGGISRNFVFGRVNQTLAAHPGTRVDLVDGSFDQLTDLLKSFELDLIFSLERPRRTDLMTVSYHRVESSPLCLAGAPALVARLEAGDVEAGPIELYMFRHHFDGAPVAERIAERFGVAVEVPVWTDDISLLRFLGNGGRGLAVVPEIGVREDLNAGRVGRVRLSDDLLVEIYAVFLTKGVRRELVDDFLGLS